MAIPTKTRAPSRFSVLIAEIGAQATFYVRALAHIPHTLKHYGKHVVKLITEISFGTAALISTGGTIGVVFALSFASGSQIGLEGFRGLDLVGLSPISGVVSAIANTRELAPIVASIALAAKVGTGFTAQLGAMRIAEEIDALETMAVPSLPFLVTTRMIAAMLAVIPLYLIGLFASYIATAFVVVDLNGQSQGTYDFFFHLFLPTIDIFYSLLKALILAVLITLIHCYYGFHASGGPEGVGRAAGRALRTSLVSIMVADMVLTLLFWGVNQQVPGMGPG
ncbi:ABC transporter permease [Pseudonocardiaceae bacterium YIM PH 21723]|nr:ABC transporter permease [Pseudonocardiaceae bacterium YIM PH 21723]